MSALAIRHEDRIVVVDVGANATVRIDGIAFDVIPVGNGLYQVADGRNRWTVAVAGPPDARWVFVDGQVAVVATETRKHGEVAARPHATETRKHATEARKHAGDTRSQRDRGRGKARGDSHELSSPMPATVVRVLVEAGQRVSRGDTLVMLEAMKMELPVRAPRDAVVQAIHCRAGELVQPGVQLIELA
jgi:biotin carboxyl carrier protein